MTLLSASGDLHVLDKLLTVDTAIYAAGDLVGGKVTLEDAVNKSPNGGGLIQSVIIGDKAKQSVDLDVFFFSGDPTGTTFTDNAPFDPADADLVKMIGRVTITGWKTFANNSVGQALQIAMPFVLESGTSLFAALTTLGAPDYVAATDLNLRVGVVQI